MRSGNILFSAAHFFVTLVVVSLGLFFLALPHVDVFRIRAAELLQKDPGVFTWIGGFVLSFGLILFITLYRINRGQFLKIKVGMAKTLIDGAIIRDYVREYWEKVHPSEDCHVEIEVHKNGSLEIITPVPKSWKGEIESPLLQLQNELKDHLALRLGYEREFYITLSLS